MSYRQFSEIPGRSKMDLQQSGSQYLYPSPGDMSCHWERLVCFSTVEFVFLSLDSRKHMGK